MHPALREFVRQVLAVATMAAAPVVLAAFLGMPSTLGRHPGEIGVAAAPAAAASSAAITPRNAA